jgi:sigma-E factor negative regulatory protein RseA
MNDLQLERLSALVDAEERDPALVDALLADPALRARWARYQLIGDALRGNLPPAIDPDFGSRLEAAVASEPPALAPGRASRPVLRPVLGLAIAASVAALGVYVVTRTGPEPAGSAPSVALRGALQPQPFGPVVAPVGFEGQDRATVTDIGRYVLQHNEQRQSMALPGTLQPYVRLIGHDTNE